MLFDPIAENVDRLMSTDLPRRGVIDTIYPLARERQGVPLAMAAAQLLHSRVKPGDLVLIATGWLDRPHVSRLVAETDGPPGAAALARAIHLGLRAIPIVLVEEELIAATTSVMHAVGLRVLTIDEALAASRSEAALHACAVVALPRDSGEGRALARRLIEGYDVGAFIAVEKGGMNEFGQIHTSRGANTTAELGKGDSLLQECISAGIATVGIGDGGNEIGMGSIAAQLGPVLRYGNDCGCGCGGGTVPAGVTDVLVSATVSNWGAYAVAACLAVLRGDSTLAHSEEREWRLLHTCTDVGLIDGVTGLVEPSADGLHLDVHLGFVRLLNAAIGEGVAVQGWDADRAKAATVGG